MGCRLLLAIGLAGLIAGNGLAQDNYIGSLFGKGKKAPPQKEAPAARLEAHGQVPPELLLTPQNGPFHIFVASYVGERNSEHAVRLATELRKLGFSAYIHNYREKEPFYRPDAKQLEQMRKEFMGKAPRFPQLKTPLQDNWVVLVGDFASLENDRAYDGAMKKLRRLTRESFSPDTVAELRWGTPANRKKTDELVGLRGTANPLRPKEEKLDEATLKTLKVIKTMNDAEPHSVYKLRAPYTLFVYKFTAATGIAKKEERSFFSPGPKQSNGMATAAQSAQILCNVLREMGEEAYVFHSDIASCVCVNGYEGPQDPRWVKDYEKYSKMKVLHGQIELKPDFKPTPKDPASVLTAN